MNVGIIGGADGPTSIILGQSGALTITGIIFGIAVMIVAYFLGNISPAILIAKAHGIDIKKEGSGNAGTTNVLRVLGKKAAVMTLAIDIGKGVAAVLIGRFVGGLASPEYAQTLALACTFFVVVGHIWPMIFKFKGGKGVATAFGAVVTLSPFLGLGALAIVIVVVLFTRRVSAGSVCAAISLPIMTYFVMPGSEVIITALALIVIYKHKENIKRLISGQEPKISFKK